MCLFFFSCHVKTTGILNLIKISIDIMWEQLVSLLKEELDNKGERLDVEKANKDAARK